MRLLLLLLFLLHSEKTVLAQRDTRLDDQKIVEFVRAFNTLPRTVKDGHERFPYESVYRLSWSRRKREFKILDNRYLPSSDVQTGYHVEYQIKVDSLHPEGVVIENASDSTVRMKVLTALHRPNIKQTLHVQGDGELSHWQSIVTLGNWNKEDTDRLQEIVSMLSTLLREQIDWIAENAPDISAKPLIVQAVPVGANTSIVHEQNPDDPTLSNWSLQDPATFQGALSQMENQEKVLAFVRGELSRSPMKISGMVIGDIVIGKDGTVERFVSFKRNNPEVELEVEKILLSLPKWKPALFKGNPVRVVETFLLRN